nr:MAG: replication associated protein [Arizlama virus]
MEEEETTPPPPQPLVPQQSPKRTRPEIIEDDPIAPKTMARQVVVTVGVRHPQHDTEDPLFHGVLPKGVKHYTYQKEIAPDTGWEHMHVYLAFTGNWRFNKIKQLLNDPTCHIEIARGTAIQAAGYSSKTDSRAPGPFCGPWSMGDLPKPGKRTDLSDIFKGLQNGSIKFRNLALDPTTAGNYARYHACFKEWITEYRPTRDPLLVPDVKLYIGASGAGKSWDMQHYLSSIYPGKNEVYQYTPDSKGYWQRYNGQRVIFLDEFSSAPFTYTLFKSIIHQGDITVPVKYGEHPLLATHIGITSNEPPDMWFNTTKYNLAPIWRSFSEVRVYTEGRPKPQGIMPWNTQNFRSFKRQDIDSDGSKLRTLVMDFWHSHRSQVTNQMDQWAKGPTTVFIDPEDTHTQ